MKIGLEHVNVTTRDPQAAAEWLGRVFGWRIRWQGSAMETGLTFMWGMMTGILPCTAHHLTSMTQKRGIAVSTD